MLNQQIIYTKKNTKFVNYQPDDKYKWGIFCFDSNKRLAMICQQGKVKEKS